MRGEDTIMMFVYALAGAWLLWLWVQDTVARREGQAHPRALPGTYPARVSAIALAVLGALGLVAVETTGEYALGVSGEQEHIMGAFLLAMLAAAVIEEVLFRGYLIVFTRGRAALLASVFGFSLLFALLHPFLWEFEMPIEGWAFWEGTWTWKLDLKGSFSTGIVFANSLWFYVCRLLPQNPERSLLPCIAAHAASNVAVFAIKWAQGFVVW